MRVFQVAATVLLVCVLIVTGVLFFGAQAKVSCTVQSEPASEHEAMFQNVVQAIQEGTADKVLENTPLNDITAYSLATLTVTVQNPGLLPMEWLTCEYMGGFGDVAVYDTVGLPADIPARSTYSFTIQLLRSSDTNGWGEFQLNYYVAGNSITKQIR